MSNPKLLQLIADVDALLTDMALENGSIISEVQTPQAVTPSDDVDLEDPDRIQDILGQHSGHGLSMSSPDLSGANPLDRFENGGLTEWTERQQSLVWYYKTFGVIGLAYKVKEIAKADILRTTGLAPTVPRLYRKRYVPAKRRHQSHNVEVEDSQEENEEESVPQEPDTLAKELELLINAQGPGHISWRRIYYDWYRGSQSRTLFYLSSVPDEVMLAVLHGDLPRKMSDASFARRHESFVRLTRSPGTYTLYIARSRTPYGQDHILPTSPQEEGVEALGLTLEEMISLWKYASRYIDVDDHAFVDHAKRIDTAFGAQGGIDYSFQRRYGASSSRNDFTMHKVFVGDLKRCFAGWVSALRDADRLDKMKVPLTRCFAHVGLSSNTLRRCPRHWTHESVPSPIFGMVTAILQVLWPGRFNVEDHSYQVFRVVSPQDLGFAEILSSIVSSAYCWNLGLSYTHAGGGGRSRLESTQFVENARCILNEGVQSRQVRASITKFGGMRKDWRQDVDGRRLDLARLNDSVVEDHDSLRDTKEALETEMVVLQVQELQDVLWNQIETSGG